MLHSCSILSQIMGIREAADCWSLSTSIVQQMCEEGWVDAKRIENTWIINRNQTPPKSMSVRSIDTNILDTFHQRIDLCPQVPLHKFITIPDHLLHEAVTELPRLSNHFCQPSTRRAINSVTKSIQLLQKVTTPHSSIPTIQDLVGIRVNRIRNFKGMGSKAFHDLLIMLVHIGELNPQFDGSVRHYTVTSLAKKLKIHSRTLIKRIESGEYEGAYQTKTGKWIIPKSSVK